jgi:competence protein ComEC
MYFPNVEVIGKQEYNPWSFTFEKILFLKKNFRDNIQKNFNAIEAMIMQGMILGDRAAIPLELKNKFNVTGTSHIIAVSGTHIVILGAILLGFLSLLGLSRSQSFYVSVVLISFYIILVGFPAPNWLPCMIFPAVLIKTNIANYILF